MEGEHVGRVVRLGRGWLEVDAGGTIRRVMSPPGLVARVGNYVALRGDVAVSLCPNPMLKPPVEGSLPAQSSQLPQ